MRSLKAFLLGAFALGVLTYALAAAFAVTAQAAGHTFELALGPLLVVAVTESATASATAFGPGILVLALFGGLLNLALALLMERGHGDRSDHVD